MSYKTLKQREQDQRELDQAQAAQPSCCDTDKHWLLVEFPFLTADGFMSATEMVMTYTQDVPESDEAFYEAAQAKTKEIARQHMEALLELAMDSENAASQKALKTLGKMLMTGCMQQPVEMQKYCMQRAAEALRFFSESGLPSYLVDCLEICLSSRLQLPEPQRINLLQALLQCADFSATQFPPCLPFERAARILHEALLLEIQRPACEQSLRYSQMLMDSMASYPHHLAAATLNALSMAAANESLKEMAAVAYNVITESLEIRWLKTCADQLASLDSRANRLARLCSEPPDDAHAVQVIFNNLKGTPIESDRDPRLPAIKTLMSFMMSSVKMASCWSLFAQGHYNENVNSYVNGLDELANLAINSGSAGLSHDAVKLIRTLKKDHPELKRRINVATENASLQFITSQFSVRPKDNSPSLPLVEAEE